MHRLPIVALACVMIAVAGPRPGDAEHISARITGGTIDVGVGSAISAVIDIAGPAGFGFTAGADSGNSEALCSPCRAGETISLSAVISPPYFGTATYRGKTYAFNFDNGGGWISLNAPSFVLPPGDAPESTTVEFATPFTVGADTRLFLQSGQMGENTHDLPLSGGGTATGTFRRVFDEVEGTYFYFFEGLRFDFAKK